MPRRPTNLRDPRVVIAVAVLFLVVAAVNLQTFLPLRSLGRASATMQTAPFTPPSDAAELTRLAAAHVTGAATTDTAPAVEPARQETRPPEPRTSGEAPVPAPAVDRESAPVPISALPTCTAILRTGARAVALIGGARRQVGDAVGAWRVAAITVDGATLKGPDGTIFLPVGAGAGTPVRFNLVTKAEATLGAGSTALQPLTGSREP
jgi:hypothetical protein